MAAQEVVEDLKSCQFEATICARDKDVEEAMQLAEDELEEQCIWENFFADTEGYVGLRRNARNCKL